MPSPSALPSPVRPATPSPPRRRGPRPISPHGWLTRLAPVALLACGDPLVVGTFRGAPLLTVSGDVLVDQPLGDLRGEVAVAALWNGGMNADDVADQSVDATMTFPSQYTLRFFQPPPESVRSEPPIGDAEGLFAMGLLLLFEDLDGDLDLDVGVEEVLGGALDHVLMWSTVTEGVDAVNAQGASKDALGGTFAVRRIAEGDCATRTPNELVINPTDVQLQLGFDCAALPDPDCQPMSSEWNSVCGRRPPLPP